MTDHMTRASGRQHLGPRSGLDVLVMLAATASAFTAAWLLIVTTTVLPRRDPGGIPFWTSVAVGFLAYSALTAVYLRFGRSSAAGRTLIGLASIAALAIGGFWIVGMLTRTGEFEGYVVLMGAILAGHGATVLLHDVTAGRFGRQTAR